MEAEDDIVKTSEDLEEVEESVEKNKNDPSMAKLWSY